MLDNFKANWKKGTNFLIIVVRICFYVVRKCLIARFSDKGNASTYACELLNNNGILHDSDMSWLQECFNNFSYGNYGFCHWMLTKANKFWLKKGKRIVVFLKL